MLDFGIATYRRDEEYGVHRLGLRAHDHAEFSSPEDPLRQRISLPFGADYEGVFAADVAFHQHLAGQ